MNILPTDVPESITQLTEERTCADSSPDNSTDKASDESARGQTWPARLVVTWCCIEQHESGGNNLWPGSAPGGSLQRWKLEHLNNQLSIAAISWSLETSFLLSFHAFLMNSEFGGYFVQLDKPSIL
jgi:hypothetical protein